MSYQGSLQLEKYLVEAQLNEALGTIRLGQLKDFKNRPVPFIFKRVSGKDGGVQEYNLLGKSNLVNCDGKNYYCPIDYKNNIVIYY